MTTARKKRVMLTPGEVVKELRQKKGWTQSILSEIVGIAVSNLSNIERNRSRLGEDRAILLAEALGVKPEFLLFPNGFERADLKPRIRRIRKKLSKMEGKTAA
ncbi:helix-turn-helix domain-containing protein [bacterium]|nr:helix-turn-helix domain-containing protein [bacterium]